MVLHNTPQNIDKIDKLYLQINWYKVVRIIHWLLLDSILSQFLTEKTIL